MSEMEGYVTVSETFVKSIVLIVRTYILSRAAESSSSIIVRLYADLPATISEPEVSKIVIFTISTGRYGEGSVRKVT
jgi:hypothetical protein